MTPTPDNLRAKFEKWAASPPMCADLIKREGGPYDSMQTHCAWLAYCAATQDAARGQAECVRNSELELILDELVEQQSESGQAPQWSPVWERARRVLASLKGGQ